MALAPGTRLGVYEVTAQIGEGGMGEVYRARDTKLGRDVALKILPESFAHDPDRLARFQREARVLASLNHPHIAALYGLEDAGDVKALVMELVEGEDLSQRIARGAIPLDEALPMAKQIAEALEAAHEHGIIHRDLKPANIKVREDGTVKVLDFGLAKALEPASALRASAGQALSQAPTLTSPAHLRPGYGGQAMTGMGVILGTAAYMSPEQAKGRAADKRSDIWAFGCVLFEMLTGRRAFDGDDMTEVLGVVVRLDPPWGGLPPDVPPPVRTLLQSCLVKDRQRRVADISTALFVLDKAASLAPPTSPDATAAPAGARGEGTRRERLVLGVAVVALVAVAALAIPAVRQLRETPPAALPETRTEIVTPATTDPISFALSPDGRQIVFVASGEGASRLWLRSLSTAAAQPLAGTEGAVFPFWSPDSRSVGFFADSRLKRLDVVSGGGGAPQTVAVTPTSRGGTWNTAGVILFAPTGIGPLFRVSASGGEAAAVTTLDRQSSHRFPTFLPDGQHFLFHAEGSSPDTSGIYLGALDAKETTRLTAADTAGRYLPSGWLLWVRGGTLVAQRLDLAQRALVGDPVTVAAPVAFDSTIFAGAVSLSTTGLVAYRSGVATSRRQLTWFDRSGKVLGTLGAPDDSDLQAPRLSPDGRRVAVMRTMQGNQDIWLLDGTRTSRFTFDARGDSYAVWSPDSSRIVFNSGRSGPSDLYVKPSSGAGREEQFLESSQGKQAHDWSGDGRFLLYQSIDPQTSFDLWVLPLDGDRPSTSSGLPQSAEGRKPWVFLKTPFQERNAAFSPDGRFVAYMSDESGRFEVYVRPFVEPAVSALRAGAASETAGGQWQVSTTGGTYTRWRADGKELYYLGPEGQMMVVPIAATGTAIAPGTPVVLFPTRIAGGIGTTISTRQFDVARDGRFLINTVLDDATASPITLLQNWNPAKP